MKFELVDPPEPPHEPRQPTPPSGVPPAPANVVPVTSLARMRDRSSDHTRTIARVIASIQPSLNRMNARIARVERERAETGPTHDDPPDGFRPDRFAPRTSPAAPQESP